ncbi:hypothetical protein COEREDRAFT_86123 [Coemansia reversa NRRL 1564]|uniref:Uncharacterized protein n=1 Tax=Coemansia reversa (strain ATCC 12441 / NRRL 1564) TaxID=763665 RepID=A0A2G5BER7_COERN|nr:hypothetical protein COEREDRAFT_86123 [Coemansia reversa NRRL 1564]|eukprot:PIA17508.1 hypothetical protein COEREDRAFT_86123 [Coemansia reversa NRRL 1564]
MTAYKNNDKIHAHTLIDIPVLLANILNCNDKDTKALLNKNEKDPKVWSPVLNLQSTLLKNKGDCKFVENIFTDGISVCVVYKSDAALEKCRKPYKKLIVTADPASASTSAPVSVPGSVSAFVFVAVLASVSAPFANTKLQKKRKLKADKLKEFSYIYEM